MNQGSLTCKVFFEDPFWVMVIEAVEDGTCCAHRTIFPKEPSDQEVYLFLLQHFQQLCFSRQVNDVQDRMSQNPKRRQREIARQMKQVQTSTKAQAALKLLQEELHEAKKQTDKKQKQMKQELQFQLKQQKRKQKHRGR